jgi:hypothetical protein
LPTTAPLQRNSQRGSNPSDGAVAPSIGDTHNCEVPEAEWGYADALTDDIVGFADEHGFQVKYLDYDHAEPVPPIFVNGDLCDSTNSFTVSGPWTNSSGFIPPNRSEDVDNESMANLCVECSFL